METSVLQGYHESSSVLDLRYPYPLHGYLKYNTLLVFSCILVDILPNPAH